MKPKKQNQTYKKPKYQVFQAGKVFGIEEVPTDNGRPGATLYDAIFPRRIADRVAELENSDTPPKDWEAAEEILLAEGFDLSQIKG